MFPQATAPPTGTMTPGSPLAQLFAQIMQQMNAQGNGVHKDARPNLAVTINHHQGAPLQHTTTSNASAPPKLGH